MLRLVLGIVVAGYLPGAVFYRLPIADRSKRAALASEERLFWQVMLSVAWSLGVVLILASFGAYSFYRLMIINTAVAVLLAVAARFRLRYSAPATRLSL